jgi:hypothetical protein
MILAMLLATGTATLRAQDTTRFRSFLDSNNVLLTGGLYHTFFRAGDASRHGPRLQANTSAYVGASLSYKWFSIYFQMNIPRTSVLHGQDKTVRASVLNVTHWWNHWGFDGSYQHDKGLVDQDDPGHRSTNSIWQWVDYKYIGVNVEYFFRPDKFSYNASHNFSGLQTKSGGSWMVMLTPSYQDFSLQRTMADTVLKDSTLFNLINKNANHVLLMAKVGYAYTFSWGQGHWMCSPLFVIGPGAGVYLDQFHTHQTFYPNLGYQARLTAGYNGDKWFFYLNGLYDLTQEPQKNLGLKTINESASLNIGYRFHSLRRRILHLL